MTTTTPSTSVDIDSVFRAFADRTRLRIMHLLLGVEELCVCDLVDVLDLPQAKVSRHLAYLRKAELVMTRRDGQWMYYRMAGARGAFHQKLLECLGCCFSEVPELREDQKRLLAGGHSSSTECC